jgi:mRNA interferase MazF
MRPIHLARLDKTRPAVVLTRAVVVPRLRQITVAPITSTAQGLSVEIPVGPANGLDHDCVVNCDNITTIRAELLGRRVGYLLADQEEELTAAIMMAFDLD